MTKLVNRILDLQASSARVLEHLANLPTVVEVLGGGSAEPSCVPNLEFIRNSYEEMDWGARGQLIGGQ